MKLNNPPQLTKDVLTIFANFYRLGGNKDHDWTSVRLQMKTYKQIAAAIYAFDYESASGPQVKLIKQATLESNE